MLLYGISYEQVEAARKAVKRRRQKLMRLLHRFADAKTELSWMGSLPPEDREAVAEEYNNALAAVRAEVERLIR